MIRKAALAVLLAGSAGAVPVDLRILPATTAVPVRASAPPPDSVDSYLPGSEIMATRMTLNDLLQIAEVLQNEARHLDADASEVWTQWRAVMPGPQIGALPAEDMRRTEVFGVMNAGRRQNTNAHRLITHLRKAEAQWWDIWNLLDAEATGQRDGSRARPMLEKFKARIETLAGESNALDAGIRQVQAQYDFVRPMMLDHLTSTLKMSPALRPAWHWNYALNNYPRPDLSYDYAHKYEEHYEESRASLSGGVSGKR